MKLTIMTICCFVLIYFISETSGCKCKNEKDKQKFCRATYVIRGTVKSKQNFGVRQVEYTMEVKNSFKIKVPNPLIVRTRKDSAACGVNLRTGEDYLISGTIGKSKNGDAYETISCYWNEVWSNIRSETQLELRSGQFDRC